MRKRIFAPVLAVMLTATLGSAGPATEPPECVLAARWVQAHSDALPTTLVELSAFSMTYRRAIYDALPPDARVSLWREHMQQFLRPESSLDDAQRAAVRDVIARLPDLTAPDHDAAEQSALTKQLAGIFDRDLGVRIFTTLGENNGRPTKNEALPTCNCNYDFDLRGNLPSCPTGMRCAPNLCNHTSTGCGLTWSEPCRNVCVHVPG